MRFSLKRPMKKNDVPCRVSPCPFVRYDRVYEVELVEVDNHACHSCSKSSCPGPGNVSTTPSIAILLMADCTADLGTSRLERYWHNILRLNSDQ